MIFIYWSLSITSLITVNSRDMASHPCICNNASAFRQEIIEFFFISIFAHLLPHLMELIFTYYCHIQTLDIHACYIYTLFKDLTHIPLNLYVRTDI